MKTRIKITLLATIAVLLTSCGAVDLRTEALKNNAIDNTEQKGKQLLEETKLAMGYDKLMSTQVYEVDATFNWNSFWLLMPMNAFPGNNGKALKLRFATNTFDGQLEYLEGRKKGTIQGVQSWNGYKQERDSDYLKQHEHDRYIWGLATYHYLLEAPIHLPDAEIIRYAGTKEMDGINYETVYITWGSEAPNNDYDRYLVYINPTTKHIDLMEVTINDFFVPMPKGMQHASVRIEREETSLGTLLPSKITIQLKSPKKPDNKVYNIKLSNYQFDTFGIETLYPIEGVAPIGFRKLNNE